MATLDIGVCVAQGESKVRTRALAPRRHAVRTENTMNWRLTALACLAVLLLSPAGALAQVADPMGRPPMMGTLFRSICMATRANAEQAGAAALAQGFVRVSDVADGALRYQTSIGATTYTLVTVTEIYVEEPGQKETCIIVQEPGDAFTTAAVAALLGAMPIPAEGGLSVWRLAEEAGQLNMLRPGEDERALAASRAHTLYDVSVNQTAAQNMIIYVHW